MIEDDETRALFFDTDDFAEEVTVTTLDGTALESITVIFDAKPVDTRPMETRFPDHRGARPAGSGPSFRCRDIDMPKSLMGKATVVIRGKTYSLFKIEHDGTGDAFVEVKLA